MSSKYSFKFTPLAEEDIGSALVYISQKLFNVKAADDLFAKIENAITHICEFPYSFIIGNQLLSEVNYENKNKLQAGKLSASLRRNLPNLTTTYYSARCGRPTAYPRKFVRCSRLPRLWQRGL